jgi:predicted nucleotide-binding protein (sugar kinase/HSP70/actin superfamily)
MNITKKERKKKKKKKLFKKPKKFIKKKKKKKHSNIGKCALLLAVNLYPIYSTIHCIGTLIA